MWKLGRGCVVSFLGIHKSDLVCSASLITDFQWKLLYPCNRSTIRWKKWLTEIQQKMLMLIYINQIGGIAGKHTHCRMILQSTFLYWIHLSNRLKVRKIFNCMVDLLLIFKTNKIENSPSSPTSNVWYGFEDRGVADRFLPPPPVILT